MSYHFVKSKEKKMKRKLGFLSLGTVTMLSKAAVPLLPRAKAGDAGPPHAEALPLHTWVVPFATLNLINMPSLCQTPDNMSFKFLIRD